MPRLSYCETPDDPGMDGPLDYCRHCWPSYEDAEEDAPPNALHVDYDIPHPAYEGEEYDCEDCGELLGRRDNSRSFWQGGC